jgi:glycerophosphoryl diester phosphodiesterase
VTAHGVVLAAALALLVVAALAPAGPSAADGPPAGSGGRRALVAAHRGGALLWPENSLLAFRNAIALGADLLETDVHLSADGVVVVLHDPTLDRTTTGTGRVRDATREALSPLRLRARDGVATAEPVPTLAELLDLVAPAGVGLLLEIKVGADRARYPGIEEKVLALVGERRLASRVVVMAFEAPTVKRIRELDPAIRAALLVGKGRVERERVGAAESVRWAMEAGATDLGVDHRVLDAALVEAARRAGLHLAAWTVNEEADLRRVVDLGVDVVTSDRPDLALRATRR